MADVGQSSEAKFNEAYKRVLALANARPEVTGDWVGFLIEKRGDAEFQGKLADLHDALRGNDEAFARGLLRLGFPTAPGSPMSSASSGFELAQTITPKMISYCRSFVVSEKGAFAAGTILTSTCVATFAHGAHAEWKVGEKKAYKRLFPKEDASPFEATVVEVNKDSDYILLKVDAKIGLPCPEVTPYLYMGMPYVVLGMSARSHHDLPSCCAGHLISSDLDRNGFLHGSSGARLGDSGAPAFVIGESTLVAMNVASAAAFGETLNRDERALCVPSGASCRNVMVLASKLLLAARDLGL